MPGKGSSRFLGAIFVFVLWAGCAEPKYARPLAAQSGEKTAAGVNSDCTLKFTQEGVCFTWQWVLKPAVGKQGQIVMKTFRPDPRDGTPVGVDVTPALVLWMPEHGHGSMDTEIRRIDVGTYQINQVVPVMAGRWLLKFRILEGTTVADELVVEQIF